MEPVLTNHARMDRNAIKKAFSWTIRKHRLLLLVFAALCLCYAVRTTLRGHFTAWDAVLYVEAAFALVLCFLLPLLSCRRELRRIEEDYHTDSLETTLEFYPDEIRGSVSGAAHVTHTHYDDLKAVAKTGGLILLWSKARLFSIVDPARFENGTEADFWRLMNEKCPKAVPRAKRTL